MQNKCWANIKTIDLNVEVGTTFDATVYFAWSLAKLHNCDVTFDFNGAWYRINKGHSCKEVISAFWSSKGFNH